MGRTLLAVCASLLVHGATVTLFLTYGVAPEMDFDFEFPSEVEFGLTEAVTVASAPSVAPAQPPVPPNAEPLPPAETGIGAAEPDAGVGPDAGPLPRPDEGVAEATQGLDEAPEGDSAGGLLPAGAQIALRINTELVRESALAEEVRQLMAALPDWRAVIGGSGIDALEDLDRIMVASPNLQRSRLIAAGRARAGRDAIVAATAELASATGATEGWHAVDGVEVAPWGSEESTPRVIALIGPAHFSISRPEDLPRILRVASARRGRGDESLADALLSMEAGDALSLEVEGARLFARSRARRRSPIEWIPTRVRLSLRQQSENEIALSTHWQYDDAPQAEDAATYWEGRREDAAANIIMRLLGLAPLLGAIDLRAEEDEIVGDALVTPALMGALLRRAAVALGGPRGGPSESGSPLDLSRPPPSPYE